MLIWFVVLYLLVSIGIGLFAATRVHSAKDFAIAGRHLPLPVVTATVFATWFGAGAIFGTTGGVMEAAVRTMYYVINGKELEHVEVAQLCGFENVRSAHVNLGGEFGEIKVAMCHGLKGTRKLVEAVLDGSADFDFIEIMACPGGCVDGGGTLRSKKAYIPYAMKRRETIFDIDRTKVRVRQSHNNRQVQKLYADYLEAPHSEKAHHMLHNVRNIAGPWGHVARAGKADEIHDDAVEPVNLVNHNIGCGAVFAALRKALTEVGGIALDRT